MKHQATRDLFAYWDRRRGMRVAPERADIEPGEIRHLLASAFMLGGAGEENDLFRLAGTRVCALFGRELKGERLGDLFLTTARPSIRTILAATTQDAIGAVAHLRGITQESQTLDLEMLLLPLGDRRRDDARILGLIIALEQAYWLGENRLDVLELIGFRHVGPVLQRFSAPSLVAVAPRPAPKFVLHQGGRHD